MALCNDFFINPADACVHFAFTAPGVAAVSLNTSNPDRVAKNVETVQNEIPCWHFVWFWLVQVRYLTFFGTIFIVSIRVVLHK